MYSSLLKVIKVKHILFTIIMLIIIAIFIRGAYNKKIFSNLNPKTLAYSELEKKPNTVIKLKSYSIVGTFKNLYKKDKNNSSKPEVSSIGYIGYDNETDKYFGFIVPIKYADAFEEEFQKYLTYVFDEENYTPNIPELLGTVRKMNEAEKIDFEKALANNPIYIDLLNEYINKKQIDFKNTSEEEFNIIEEEIKKLAQSKTDFYIIKYKNLKDIFWNTFKYLFIITVCFLFCLYEYLKNNKYAKLEKLKNQINSNPNFTEPM